MDGASYTFEGPQASPGGGAPGEIEIEHMEEGRLEGDVLTVRLRDGTTLRFQRS